MPCHIRRPVGVSRLPRANERVCVVWNDHESHIQVGFFLLPTKAQTSSHSMESPFVAGRTLSSRGGSASTFFERGVDGVGADFERAADTANRDALVEHPFDGGFLFGGDS